MYATRTMPRDRPEVAALKAINAKVLTGFGLMRGASHTEFMRAHADGEFYFIETSARVGGASTAEMVEAATGVNLWSEWAWLEAHPNDEYKLPPGRQRYAGVVISLAKQERPDTSPFTDHEIVSRLDKKHHVGFVVAADNTDRVEQLLTDYMERIRHDYHTVLPPATSALYRSAFPSRITHDFVPPRFVGADGCAGGRLEPANGVIARHVRHHLYRNRSSFSRCLSCGNSFEFDIQCGHQLFQMKFGRAAFPRPAGVTRMIARSLTMVSVLVGAAIAAAADPPENIRDLKLRDWRPKSMMVTKVTPVERPMFPVVDMHNHLGSGKDTADADGRETSPRRNGRRRRAARSSTSTAAGATGSMKRSPRSTKHIRADSSPSRSSTLTASTIPTGASAKPSGLEESFKAGAKGLKFYKSPGPALPLQGRPTDAPWTIRKLDPVWEMCAKHQRPVVIHVADPAAFFTPLDRFNERWHELNSNPQLAILRRQKLRNARTCSMQLHRVIAKHPETTFINTHFGNNAEDLASVAEKLDKYPNMFIDIDARISELGRQPYTTRKFFLKYQDRIMFGTDTPPQPRRLSHLLSLPRNRRRVFRLLRESSPARVLEYLRHLSCPKEVLEKVYRTNAERILYGLKPEGEKPSARRNCTFVRPMTSRSRATAPMPRLGQGRVGIAAQTYRQADARTRRASRCCIPRKGCTS